MTEPVFSGEDQDEQINPVNNFSNIVPQVPFGNIGLTFSGGGFRAASFSLGVLSYLHRIRYKSKPILESVKFITSTSGGSLTNGAYCVFLYRHPSEKFASFYDHLRKLMDGENLLKNAIETLEDKTCWTEEGILRTSDRKAAIIKKQRNLINAFAKTYDKLLFDRTTLKHIADKFKDTNVDKPHLEAVCFNCTEFNNGLNFYFQVNGSTHRVSHRGNGYLKFTDFITARNLKLSDIVAASSCFPGGFEPIIYPNDFVHAGATNVNTLLEAIDYGHNSPLKQKKVFRKPFALMDGGIADNMGLHSILIEDSERRKNSAANGFDLILSCDVTSYFNDPLVEPLQSKSKVAKFLSIKKIIQTFRFSTIVFLLSLTSIITQTIPVAGYLLVIPSGLLALLYWIGFFRLKQAKKQSSGMLSIALRYLDYFEKLPLATLWPMISTRINSSVQLVGDLFLKQIRRIQYNGLFDQPILRDRAIACLVYEFSKAHESRRLKNLASRDAGWWPMMKNILMPSPELQKMVDEARVMGTTLWFSKEDEQKKDQLIATGQVTTCYSLIKHIKRLQVNDPAYETDPSLSKLLDELLKDWIRFQTNPLFMIDKLDAS